MKKYDQIILSDIMADRCSDVYDMCIEEDLGNEVWTGKFSKIRRLFERLKRHLGG